MSSSLISTKENLLEIHDVVKKSCNDTVKRDLFDVQDEIEQNFKDSHSVGIDNVLMLIFGFPTEEPIDVYDTMTMLWRIRFNGIRYISTGIGCFVAEDNIEVSSLKSPK